MAPSRRQSNGRSPLVNQQRQITSFFTKFSSSPSPSPSPVLSQPKSNPNLSPNLSPSPSPTTPSPRQAKPKKPLLVIGQSPSSPSTPASHYLIKPKVTNSLYGDEVVNQRIRVYWPLDDTWYEGCVMSFDKISGKHLVQYDDAQEELLELAKEKIELVKEPVKRFRRLRKFSIKGDEEEEEEDKMQNVESDSDDSMDEDWGKKEDGFAVDDEMEDIELEEEEDDGAQSVKSSKKRKLGGGVKIGLAKKTRTVGDVKKIAYKVTLDVNAGKCVKPTKNNDCKQ